MHLQLRRSTAWCGRRAQFFIAKGLSNYFSHHGVRSKWVSWENKRQSSCVAFSAEGISMRKQVSKHQGTGTAYLQWEDEEEAKMKHGKHAKKTKKEKIMMACHIYDRGTTSRCMWLHIAEENGIHFTGINLVLIFTVFYCIRLSSIVGRRLGSTDHMIWDKGEFSIYSTISIYG